MISACLGSNDLARAQAFYDAVMATIGCARTMTLDHELGYGPPGGDRRILYVVRPYDGQSATAGNGTQISFRAASRDAVDAFHAAALAHGGSDEGAPGPRDYRPGYYGAYCRDPDGNKLHAVHLPD